MSQISVKLISLMIKHKNYTLLFQGEDANVQILHSRCITIIIDVIDHSTSHIF